ncbi:hypothetical protein WCLP8_2120003 [uncultured Gammaproteobacteria bacterium]
MDKLPQTTIGDRLRQIADEYGIHLTSLAALVDIPYRTMQNYARNEREPTAGSLIKIHDKGMVNINWLLTGEGHPFQVDYLDKDIIDKVLFIFINEILDICLRHGRNELSLNDRQLLISYLMHHSKLGVGDAIRRLIEEGEISKFGDFRNLYEWRDFIKEKAKPPKRKRKEKAKEPEAG